MIPTTWPPPHYVHPRELIPEYPMEFPRSNKLSWEPPPKEVEKPQPQPPAPETSQAIDKIRQQMEDGFAEIRKEITGMSGMFQQAEPQFRAVNNQTMAR